MLILASLIIRILIRVRLTTNNVRDSFAVGFGQKDFSVESGLVTVGDVGTNDANLYVTGWISGETLIDRSSFYDKDNYGRALDYLVDSSRTIKLNAQGEKEYNHEADPEFVQRWINLKDYDKYTEEEVWDELLNRTVTRRIYQTRQELGSSVTMKLSWLTQCVFELRQENEMLKAEIAKLKEAVVGEKSILEMSFLHLEDFPPQNLCFSPKLRLIKHHWQ